MLSLIRKISVGKKESKRQARSFSKSQKNMKSATSLIQRAMSTNSCHMNVLSKSEQRKKKLTPNNAKESTTAFDGFPCAAGIQIRPLLASCKHKLTSFQELEKNKQ